MNAKWYIQRIDQAPFAAATGAHYISAHAPRRMHQYVREAFYVARHERRPVVIGVPYDLQKQLIPELGASQPSSTLIPDVESIPPNPKQVDALVEKLEAAKCPIILAGKGVLISDARRQVEADAQRQAIAENEMRQKMADEQAEFRAGQLATKGDEYYAAIQSQVTNNWFRPPTARPGLRCRLKIVQIPGGEVISAAIAGKCNADEATRRSLVAAVERAGSLPYRGFEDVFEREIAFIFTYDDD